MSNAADIQSVHRAIADLRRGSPVLLCANSGYTGLIRAAEQVSTDGLAALARQSSSAPYLLISVQRAKAVGFRPKASAVACSIILPERLQPEDILGLIGDLPLKTDISGLNVLPEDDTSMACLALMVMRMARLMPAALAAHMSFTDDRALQRWAQDRGVLVLDEDKIRSFEAHSANLLREAARARLPLEDAENAEIAIFRPLDGGTEHFALLIHPADGTGMTTPPLVRIHSQCITGDLLGSLKCDCGTQLRSAIRQMAESGGGILIYLAQEGRDIGLVNKLRAYSLQDSGLDTVDANHALGFETDHRYFLPAAVMLHQLGHDTIRLMTNNPDKIEQVRSSGVEVVERIPLMTGRNPHNDAYLNTKKNRTGHLID